MPFAPLKTGIKLFYRQAGVGEPVIWIPGTSMDHGIWGFQVADLSSRYSMIVVDPRGAGQSGAPDDPGSYSVRAMAEDIVGLLDHLGIGRAHIAGMSLGSAIAQEVALNHPDRVSSIQLHATWGRSDAWFRQVFVEPMISFLDSGNMKLLFKFGQGMIMSPAYLEERGPARVAEMVTRCLVKNPHPTTRDGLRGQLQADSTHDAFERLPQIRVPTLVTVGECDTNTPQRYGRDVAAQIPHAQLHAFMGRRAGHCTFWEMPEEFNAVVGKFLDAHSSAPKIA